MIWVIYTTIREWRQIFLWSKKERRRRRGRRGRWHCWLPLLHHLSFPLYSFYSHYPSSIFPFVSRIDQVLPSTLPYHSLDFSLHDCVIKTSPSTSWLLRDQITIGSDNVAGLWLGFIKWFVIFPWLFLLLFVITFLLRDYFSSVWLDFFSFNFYNLVFSSIPFVEEFSSQKMLSGCN